MHSSKPKIKKGFLKNLLSRKKKIRRKNNARTRRAFKWSSEEATGYVIRHKGKLRFFRVPYYPKGSSAKIRRAIQRTLAKQHFLETSIFHSLFPQNSITPVELAREQVIPGSGSKVWGTVSEIIRGRSTDYKRYQTEKYADNAALMSPEAEKHDQFFEKTAKPLVESIREKTGIQIHDHPVNVANVRGKPIFMELSIAVPKKLRKYIESLPISEKEKKRIIHLLDELNKIPKEQKSILSSK